MMVYRTARRNYTAPRLTEWGKMLWSPGLGPTWVRFRRTIRDQRDANEKLKWWDEVSKKGVSQEVVLGVSQEVFSLRDPLYLACSSLRQEQLDLDPSRFRRGFTATICAWVMGEA